MKFSKNVNNKKHAPKLIFFNEKKIEKDADNFWCRKLTLKVRNCHFSIAWFRAEVDLTKNLFDEKVLFFTQLSYHLMCKLLKKSCMLSITHLLATYHGIFFFRFYPHLSTQTFIKIEYVSIRWTINDLNFWYLDEIF